MFKSFINRIIAVKYTEIHSELIPHHVPEQVRTKAGCIPKQILTIAVKAALQWGKYPD